MKKLILILSILFFTKGLFATGAPVFDMTAAANAVQTINALQEMIKYNTEMAKKIGDGNFTPATINWMGNWWTKCGGGKFTLPDWFPHPKLNICAEGNKEVEIGVDWYEKDILVGKDDTPAEVKKKIEKQKEAARRVRSYTLSKSVLEMQRAGEDQKSIDAFQQGLLSSSDQIAIAKLQTQVMIQILAELQKLNVKQAEMVHLTAIKD